MWPLPNSDKQIILPHHPRTTCFAPPSSAGASGHRTWRCIGPTCACDLRLGSSGLNSLTTPDIAPPLAFNWLSLGPELSWLVAGFCAHYIWYRARDARLAPKKSCQLSHITTVLLVASVMWTASPASQTLGVSRLFLHMAYDIEPADGNERSSNKPIENFVARASDASPSVDLPHFFFPATSDDVCPSRQWCIRVPCRCVYSGTSFRRINV